MGAAVEGLEEAIGYIFRDKSLLSRALTHRSFLHEQAGSEDAGLTANEQFEFLGDSILGFLVSEALVRRFPALPEGRLSTYKAHLVSAAHLHEVARELGLGQYLLLGRGEALSGGRDKKALLADAIEAVIAAVYLDGGLEPVRAFVSRFIVGDLDQLPLTGGADYKSALQELAQARKLPPPRYVTVRECGPEHAKLFTVEVRVGRHWKCEAEDVSKKGAGKKAARMLLAKLMESPQLFEDVQDGG